MKSITLPSFPRPAAYLPVLAWAGMIFLFSNQSVLPSLSFSALDFLSKKLAHVFVYGVLYFLLYIAGQRNGHSEQQLLLWPLLIVLLYAVTDEFHQSLISGRQATLRDIGYDLLGSLIVFLRLYRYI